LPVTAVADVSEENGIIAIVKYGQRIRCPTDGINKCD